MPAKVFVFGLLVSFVLPAQAKVFNFKDERVAGYIRATYGFPGIGDTPYADSSGTSTNFSDEISNTFGGEVGFLFGLTENIAIRAGFAAVRGRNSELEGDNSSGTKLMDVSSTILALGPTATLEYLVGSSGTSRWVFFGGAAWNEVAMENEYELTTAGTTQYTGASATYQEKSDSQLISAHFGVAFEALLVDNVTWMFEVGYRMMNIEELKYRSDTTNAVRGGGTANLTDGQVVTNDNGSDRGVDMSGAYVGLNLRFFIPYF